MNCFARREQRKLQRAHLKLVGGSIIRVYGVGDWIHEMLLARLSLLFLRWKLVTSFHCHTFLLRL